MPRVNTQTPPTPPPIPPTIRLISATPSASGASSSSSVTNLAIGPSSSWSPVPPLPIAPSAIAPKPDQPVPRKRLVPKKSKLSLLTVRSDRERDHEQERDKERGKDLSDVVRRIGADREMRRARGTAPFEIYVDPRPMIDDEDISEIVVVRKRKSRAGLDGVRWGSVDQGGSGTLGEVTNVPRVKEKERVREKVKSEESKWWSLARGRKDSKEKEKHAKGPNPCDPYPRSKTPEPFKTTQQPELSRTRFNSLGANFLFSSSSSSSTSAPPAPPPESDFNPTPEQETKPKSESQPAPEKTRTRSRTLTAGGLFTSSSISALAPQANANANANASGHPTQTQTQGHHQNQGSIALRAMRSMRSLARIGSWAQLRGGGGGGGGDENMVPGSVRVKEKKEKSGKKEKGKDGASEEGKKKGKSKKVKKKEKEAGDVEGEEKEGKKKRKLKKEREMIDLTATPATVRPNRGGSTSSFEVGSASPVFRDRDKDKDKDNEKEKEKGLGNKKRSILGLGLPSTIGKSMSMRLRNGSSASMLSLRDTGTVTANKLSVPANAGHAHSPILIIGRDRAASVLSSTSTTHTANSNGKESLRPVSVASTVSGNGNGERKGKGSRLSSGSGCSVKWDEGCLESGKEVRRREREERERERVASREKEGKGRGEKGRGEREREKRREREEGRKRTPISEVFPEWARAEGRVYSEEVHEEREMEMPVVLVESATADGHSDSRLGCDEVLHEGEEQHEEEEDGGEKQLETPIRRARHRWHSEQLVGRNRPRPLYEGEDGVLSILDAATNDLAQLINHLDLEATPATPDDIKPLSPSSPLAKTGTKSGDTMCDGHGYGHGASDISNSPTKNKSKPRDVPSLNSLRPYAQSRRNTLSTGTGTGIRTKPSVEQMSRPVIGKRIAPWPMLFSPVQSPKASSTPPPDKDRHKDKEKEKERHREKEDREKTPLQRGRRRTMTPGPEPEPEPVFQPLRPAKSRGAIATLRAQFEAAGAVDSKPKQGDRDSTSFFGGATGTATVRAPSLRTFGSHSSSRVSKSESFASESSLSSWPTPNRSPVFRRAPSPSPSPAVPMEVDEDNDTVPIPHSKRKVLGMSATMGTEDVELDVSDPDSDIPDELQVILNGGGEGDTMSYRFEGEQGVSAPMDILESGPVLSTLAIPTFRMELIDNEIHPMHAADVDAMSFDEDCDNTKKSFDFTAEIRKLNESGASDRHSFVEQLENAFRTPAKVDLRYAFPGSLLDLEVPPVPKLPAHLVKNGVGESSQEGSDERSADMGPTSSRASMAESDEKSHFDLFSGSQIMDVKEPTLLQGSDSLASNDETHDIVMSDASPLISRSLKPVPSFSRPSDGQLNKAFKFGGLPKEAPPVPALPPQQKQDTPKTLADIIPPPSHVRSLSNASSLMLEDDSVLKSIFSKASDIPQPRPRLDSDSSVKSRVRGNAQTQYRHSRHSSGISFAGFESFDEVRRGFEFSGDQQFYPPPSRRAANPRQRDSLLSIASVSSYGKAHDYGLADPFDYGLPSLRESPSSENLSISMSMNVDDTFSFIHRQPRKRVASDASSFYFRSSRRQSRRESGMSAASLAPPVSLFNRGLGSHRRTDSASSAQSVALSYATHGASGGRAIWARHHRESSIDSVSSDFSAMRLGRPDIGDKMFDGMLENSVGDYCVSLHGISVSPLEGAAHPTTNTSSFEFDSIIDHEPRSSTVDDSLFEKPKKSSSLPDSIFGCNDDSQASKGARLEVPRYRPLSIISMDAPRSPVREDDTMISMLGGGHVRRRSIDASPCPRIEKRKHSEIEVHAQGLNSSDEYHESPNKARIVEKPSIASTSSSFEDERMIKAKHVVLERQSPEEAVLIAEGEDLESSLPKAPMFSRPESTTRSRSSTCTCSSGGDTPPLSASGDFSSMDEGSQSSIDLNQINAALADTTQTISTLARPKVRARARGHGHRRRAQASRSSVYETIEEEKMSSPSSNKTALISQDTPTICQSIFIMEPETDKVDLGQTSDDESGFGTLRRYYALKDEAQTTVVESKRIWHDTPFSIFAVQSFEPPRHPAGMQALLDHSIKNYGPLPSELRPRRARSRTSSRPSPYPQVQARVSKVVPCPPEKVHSVKNSLAPAVNVPVLQQVPTNTNIVFSAPLHASKPFSPLVKDIEPKEESPLGFPHNRPRIGSAVRRNTPGRTKRSTGGNKTSTDLKENVGQGTLTTSGNSLRINRPRPRGRLNPASTVRPIRV
ncbi:hypothetical protein E4T56_gene18279 [Termitomyces sp. T112]|nr:hypothetical protein E4T56_gene18279 [Termitomyces sp. T112]